MHLSLGVGVGFCVRDPPCLSFLPEDHPVEERVGLETPSVRVSVPSLSVACPIFLSLLSLESA